MTQSVNINLYFNATNDEVVQFNQTLQEDLKRCLTRFKITPIYSTDHTKENITLLFLSVNDLKYSDFLSQINSFIDKRDIYILNLDLVNENIDGVKLHVFPIFRFWDEIVETGEIRLFRKSNIDGLSLYWEKITDIAFEIFENLTTANDKLISKPHVYLAQTDAAQATNRDNIKRDIIELGYNVLPEKQLSPEIEESKSIILDDLKDSSLIIHPIPLVYSRYFLNSDLSVVEYQCNLSAQYITESKKSIYRIIWIPSELDIVDEGNQIFVEKVQRDLDQSTNSMVLKVSLEELKKIYRRLLTGDETETKNCETQLPDIYLITDEEIKDHEKQLKISGKNDHKIGFNFKGITYNQHLRNLANAEVVIINYTSENMDWLSVKVNEILKSPGLNIARPFKRLILVKETKELETSNLDSHFSEIYTGSLEKLNLNLEVKPN